MFRKYKNSIKRGLACGLVLAMVGNLTLSSATTVVEAQEAAGITWMNMLHTPSPPTETITNALEEYTNTDLEFIWIPDASKEERLTTALASGNLADIVTLTILNNSSVRNSIKAGLFWDVGPYIDDYENLAAMSDDFIASASIDGKLYGVPFQKPLARNGVIIRADWLENLGLEAPTTLDELYEVARAFTEDDPDGDGNANTIGFTDRADLKYGAFKTLATYFGMPNEWNEEDGRFTPQFDTEEYVEAMDYMKSLYDNGYLTSDFAVTAKTDQQEAFAQGKAGIYVGNLTDARNLNSMAQGIQDEMEIVQVNELSVDGENPVIWSDNNGVGGLLAFPVSEVETEEELRAILQFVNDLIDVEAYTLMTHGIDGVHSEIDGNVVTRIDEDLWQQEVQPFASSRPKEVGYDFLADDPVKQTSDELILENENIALINPAYALESETFTTYGSELATIIDDATYKYILGDINLDEFKAEVQRWYDDGGQQIVEEYEAAFAAIN